MNRPIVTIPANPDSKPDIEIDMKSGSLVLIGVTKEAKDILIKLWKHVPYDRRELVAKELMRLKTQSTEELIKVIKESITKTNAKRISDDEAWPLLMTQMAATIVLAMYLPS